jgi:hypothetical protein
MDSKILNKTLDRFISNKSVKKISETEEEVCNLDTGECYTMKSKDGIVERLNKKYYTEDGRQLLQD